MSTLDAGEFDLPPSPGHDGYITSIKDFDQSQEALSLIALDLVKLPNERRINTFKMGCDYAGLAFQIAVSTILESEDLDSDEKAKTVVALYRNADEQRVNLFNSLAPEAMCVTKLENARDLEETIKTRLDDEEGVQEIVADFNNGYAEEFSADASQFLACLRSTKKAKAISLVRRAGLQTAEVGKIAVGVAIGTIAARQALKRFDD